VKTTCAQSQENSSRRQLTGTVTQGRKERQISFNFGYLVEASRKNANETQRISLAIRALLDVYSFADKKTDRTSLHVCPVRIIAFSFSETV
jgi:hypothetical protein